MVNDGARKRGSLVRLMADLQAAKVELLSAQCAVDRLRLQYSVEEIVSVGDRETLERAIASAHALNRFFSQVEAQIKLEGKTSS
jgi:hypothetical protein